MRLEWLAVWDEIHHEGSVEVNSVQAGLRAEGPPTIILLGNNFVIVSRLC